ncbi:ABC transporter substrate-binding protein [Neisseria sp. Ec49-e6-T10]|uniref:ABC transporter substrate-binding protein n=1 Tax=Neisseria sp. Ec49-e6-T10 TaxID=3140744 RepID=UPI003EBA2C54
MLDSLGRQVSVKTQPKRIITIFSSNTEIVTALGLTDQIVGIDAYTYYPDAIKNKPKIGGRLGFSLDKIIQQQPDLVIMTTARQATHQLIKPLEKMSIPTVVLESRNIDEILQNIKLIAHLTGKDKEGQILIEHMQTRLKKATTKPQSYKKPKVVLLTGKVGNGLLLATRSNNYTADILLKAGAILALDENNTNKTPQLSQISPEVLLSTNPDILLYAGSAKDLAQLSSIPGWQQMKAVKNKAVYIVPRSELLIPGPRVINGVERLAQLFDQWNRKQ